MTSLLGRMLRLFPGSVLREDLFTEAVAHLFETKPKLCLEWLESERLLSTERAGRLEEGMVSILSQKWLGSTETRVGAGRIDLQIEVRWSPYEPDGLHSRNYGEGTALTDVMWM